MTPETPPPATEPTAAASPIIVYGHPGCPMVGPVRRQLEQAGVAYTYIDIRQDDEARGRVRQINHGNESVPTLVFPDGSSLTEPGRRALAERLAEAGYIKETTDARPRGLAALRADPTLLLILLLALGMVLYGVILSLR